MSQNVHESTRGIATKTRRFIETYACSKLKHARPIKLSRLLMQIIVVRILLKSLFDQWRNVISGGPRFKLFEWPPSRSSKGTSRAPCMHKFSSGYRACSLGKFLNLDSLKCHFPDFGERFYRILMVRKRHCCSIGYSLSLGAPLGLGAPGISRSEPIVVTPLSVW
jgi:hypothetical protein